MRMVSVSNACGPQPSRGATNTGAVNVSPRGGCTSKPRPSIWTHMRPADDDPNSTRHVSIKGRVGWWLITMATVSASRFRTIELPGAGEIEFKRSSGRMNGSGSDGETVPATATPVAPSTRTPAAAPAIFSPRLNPRFSSARITPAGAKPAGTGGTAGAPSGTRMTIGDATEARASASQLSWTGTENARDVVEVASENVMTMRYSTPRTALVGRGRNASHPPSSGAIRTEYQPPSGPPRNWSSAPAAPPAERAATLA